jgi:DNA-binding IscR family transcriptional regulator
MWTKLGEVIDDYLESITLEDLLQNHSQTPGDNYTI